MDEFACRALEAWAYRHGIQLAFIRPGKPVENAYIESFNGRLRDESLNTEVFFCLEDIRQKLERWRHHCNPDRPHSSLRDRSPGEFRAAWDRLTSPSTTAKAATLSSRHCGVWASRASMSLDDE